MSAITESRFILESTATTAVLRVIHRSSGKQIGVVARRITGAWVYGCTHDGCGGSETFSTPEAAVLGLNAHDLAIAAERIRAEVASGKITMAMVAGADRDAHMQQRTFITLRGRAVLDSLGISVADVYPEDAGSRSAVRCGSCHRNQGCDGQCGAKENDCR